MRATVLRGDVFDVLPTVAAGSVDCCVTSPPYWQLRSYLPEGHPLKPRELGSEKTPAEYVARMVEVFRLVRDALAPWGTCWLNVGDTYAGGASGQTNLDAWAGTSRQKDESSYKHRRLPARGVAPGNLCLIPWRLAISLQDDGWLVRSVVVWHKPAPMPASLAGWRWARCRVKVAGSRRAAAGTRHADGSLSSHGARDGNDFDSQARWADCPGCPKCEPHGGFVLRRGSWRPTSSWEPVLMLAKGATYYADGEAVKTPPAAATVSRDRYTRVLDDPDEPFAVRHDHETLCESGANLRDVWTIAAEPLKERHYAAFPSELVYRCLAAGTSQKGYCPACGVPWCRVVEPPTGGTTGKGWTDHLEDETVGRRGGNMGEPNAAFAGWKTYTPAQTLGWRPSCNCVGADSFAPRPGLVLDPFCGSGRAGVQTRRLGLDFVGCELNSSYADMAERLLRDDCPLFSE